MQTLSPSNVEASVRKIIFAACATAIGLYAALEALPSPDPSFTFQCPNYSHVRVYRANWNTKSFDYVKTIPATCNDDTAVTWGFYR
jgi:hypothetical protein